MKTTATIIADSRAPTGERLTTFQVCFPRFILAEVNTHRVLSRNYRSSRAVPVAKLIEEVRTSPFIPSQFTRNKPGMQGGDALAGEDLIHAEKAWRNSAQVAAGFAEILAQLGVHKQYANRGLEPYLYVHGVISATEWENFFALRCHPDAQPEFQELATLMRDAMAASKAILCDGPDEGDGWSSDYWHLPYISIAERHHAGKGGLETLKRMSAARCAWVSYKPYDDSDATDMVKVDRTLEKLLSTPMHASPFEHQATPGNTHPNNFHGWVQQRQLIEEDRENAS
jgi:hypothetical protein